MGTIITNILLFLILIFLIFFGFQWLIINGEDKINIRKNYIKELLLVIIGVTGLVLFSGWVLSFL
jgi:TRAP-type C4-dicarboxylate transport system permease small subunit